MQGKGTSIYHMPYPIASTTKICLKLPFLIINRVWIIIKCSFAIMDESEEEKNLREFSCQI